MREPYKCPCCGYKNYSIEEDIQKRKKKLRWPIIVDKDADKIIDDFFNAPEPPTPPPKRIIKEDIHLFQNIREAIYIIKDFFKKDK